MDQRLQDPAGAAPPDWQGLCEELLRELENTIAVHYGEGGTHHISAADAVIAKADAALAQPEPEVVGPSDEELLELAAAEMRNAPNWPDCDYDARNPFPYEAPGVAWLNFARAVLARFGSRPAPAPEEPQGDWFFEFEQWLAREMPAGTVISDPLWWAPRIARAATSRFLGSPGASRLAPAPAGELRKEAAWLRNECSAENAEGNWISMSIDQALDLADLLERQAAPVPVAVSDRLPQPEDCDAEGRCWFWQTGADGAGKWELCAPCYYSSHYQLHGNTHWLPAHALPSGEVEHG